jgi:hypothetical protein
VQLRARWRSLSWLLTTVEHGSSEQQPQHACEATWRSDFVVAMDTKRKVGGCGVCEPTALERSAACVCAASPAAMSQVCDAGCAAGCDEPAQGSNPTHSAWWCALRGQCFSARQDPGAGTHAAAHSLQCPQRTRSHTPSLLCVPGACVPCPSCCLRRSPTFTTAAWGTFTMAPRTR